jgi:hypothetical protein
MGLRAAFKTVHPGERIMYRQNGILVNIKPCPQGSGYAARVWIKRGADTYTSPAYERVDTAWITTMEHLLRDLGIDPDAYHLVAVPETADPFLDRR